MSHAAHRYGTKEELKDDYNILVKPYKGIDDENETTREEAIFPSDTRKPFWKT